MALGNRERRDEKAHEATHVNICSMIAAWPNDDVWARGCSTIFRLPRHIFESKVDQAEALAILSNICHTPRPLRRFQFCSHKNAPETFFILRKNSSTLQPGCIPK